MKSNQIIHELLVSKSPDVMVQNEPLRQWFLRNANIYADNRAGYGAGQDFSVRALEKAIAALERRDGEDIKQPRKWLQSVIANAWKDESKSYAREQQRYELDDVPQGNAQAAGLSLDERAAVRARNKARRDERMRQLEQSKAITGRTLRVKDKRGVERNVEGALTREEYDDHKQDRWAEMTPSQRAERGLDPYGASQWRT